MIKIASLFTGVGGAEIGFANAFGKDDIQHLWFAEWDKFASQVLAHRFPGVPNHNDVTKIDWTKLERPDICHASPPCQSFSVAGKQKGMEKEAGFNLRHCSVKQCAV